MGGIDHISTLYSYHCKDIFLYLMNKTLTQGSVQNVPGRFAKLKEIISLKEVEPMYL